MRPRSFEEKLRESTDEFSLVPKPGTWENIESQLPPEKSRKKGAFWLVGAAVLLIAAGVGIQYIAPSTNDHSEVSSRDPLTAQHPTPPNPPVEEGAISQATQGTDFSHQNTSAALPDNSASNRSQSPHKNTSGNLPNNLIAGGSHSAQQNTSSGNPLAGRSYSAQQNTLRAPNAAAKTNSHTNQAESLIHEGTVASNQPSGVSNSVTNQEPQPSTANAVGNDSPSLKHENIVASNIASSAVKPVQKDSVLQIKEIPNLKDYLGKRFSRQVIFSELVLQPILSGSRVVIDKKYKDDDTYKGQQLDRQQNDKRFWTFGIGLQAGLEKKRWIVTAGLFYQKLSYQMAVQNINSGIISGSVSNKTFNYDATDSFALGNFSAPNRIAGAPPVIEGGRDYVTNTYEYLSIPIGMTYKLKCKGRFNIGLSANVMQQFLLSYNGLLYQQESGLYVKQRSAQENHVMRRNSALAGGLELSYHLGMHSNLFARPQYGFTLFPAEKAAISTFMRFRVLSVGYRYYF